MAFTLGVLAGTTSFTVAAFAASILGQFVISTVLGAAMRALSPKPSMSGQNRGYQTTAIGTALDHQIIYGKMLSLIHI